MGIKSIFISNLNFAEINRPENWQSGILSQEKTNLLLKITTINRHLKINNKKHFGTKHMKTETPTLSEDQ